jgi:GT2 family glycosyltransferase
VLLLNNDAVADAGLPEALAAAAVARPDAGVLACKVFFADPPDVLMYAGGRVNLRLGYWGRQDGFGQRDDGRFDVLRDVDRATGAAMAVSRAAIERAGLLDESLFAYAEDTEWCLRIREAGFGVVFVPDAKVWHVGSASTGGLRSPTSMYYDTRNMIAVAERHDPRRGAAAAIRRGVVLGAHLASARDAAGVRAAVKGWRDARRGRLGRR